MTKPSNFLSYSLLAMSFVIAFLAFAEPLKYPAEWDFGRFFGIKTTSNDVDALNAFATATNATGWTTPQWTLPLTTASATASPAPVGLTFTSTASGQRLQKLELSNKNLVGTIPSDIEKWTELTTLDLSNNKLTGSIPSQIAKLTKLTTLNLSGNGFTTIPDISALTALTSANLANNKFDFGQLESLAGKSGITMSPQQTLDLKATSFQTITLSEGDNFDFSTAIGTPAGTTTLVQLFRNGTAIANPTSKVPALTDVKRGTDDGSYVVKLTNTKLAGVTLEYKTIQIFITACELANNAIDFNGEKSIQVCEGSAMPLISATIPTNNLSAKAPTLYQWQQSVDFKTTWSDINSPSTANLNLQIPFLSANTTYYRRIATNGRCIQSVSNDLEVKFIKKISNNLITTPDQTICAGQTVPQLGATIPTGGFGAPYSYQWQYSTNQTDWITYGTTQSLTNPPLITATSYFRRQVVVNSCNFNTADVVSNLVKVEVFPNFPTFSIGTAQTICPNVKGESLKMIFSTTGNPAPFTSAVGSFTSVDLDRFTYQWQKSSDGGKSWTIADSLNAGNREFVPFVSAATDYRLTISGLCGFITSNSVRVNTYSQITNNAIAVSVGTSNSNVYCEGDFTTITLTGSRPSGGGGSYTYTWQSSLDSKTWADRGTTDTLRVNNPSDLTYYRRVVKSLCFETVSNFVSVQVLFNFGENTIGNSQNICQNTRADVLFGTKQKGKGSFVFEWQFSPDSTNWKKVAIDSLAKQPEYRPDSLVGTIYYRRAVIGGCKINYSNIVVINTSPFITGNIISPISQIICENELFTTVLGQRVTGGGGKYEYEWQSSVDNKNWSKIAATENLEPARIRQSTFYRRLVEGSECNTDTSNVILINVINDIGNNIIRDTREVCAPAQNSFTSLTLTGSQATGGETFLTVNSTGQTVFSSATVRYTWQSTTDGFKNIRAEGSSQSLTVSNLSRTTQYRRIVEAGNCFATASNIVTITVVEQIRGNNITSNSQTICFGQIPKMIFATVPTDGVGLFLYQWQVSRNAGTTWSSISNAINQNYEPLSAPDTTSLFRRVARNTCFTDTSFAINVNVLPLPKIGAGKDTVINIGQSIRLQATGGVSYRWLADSTLSDTLSSRPIVKPRVATRYIVIGTDSRGCSNRDTVLVRVNDVPITKAVEIITPNGDGLNDFFYIQNLELYPENTLIIFNRLGKQIYQQVNYKNDFNGMYEGKLLPTGVYFYLMKFKVTERVVKGSFTILSE